jgi:hypothetical protein
MDDEFARFFGAKDEAWLSDVHFWIADEKQKKKKQSERRVEKVIPDGFVEGMLL